MKSIEKLSFKEAMKQEILDKLIITWIKIVILYFLMSSVAYYIKNMNQEEKDNLILSASFIFMIMCWCRLYEIFFN